MLPPSERERPPADRAAAHPVTAPEADAGVASSLTLSESLIHEYDRNRSQTLNLPMQTYSDAASEPASDSDSGSDPFYGLQAETDQPTSPTAPLASFPPLPPPEARSRAPEFYGFVAWTSTYLLFVLYLLWAFLPDAAVLALGVTWYPNRCVGNPVLFAAKRMLMVPCSHPRMTVNLRPHTPLRTLTDHQWDARVHVSARLRLLCARPPCICIPVCMCAHPFRCSCLLYWG